MKPTKKLRRDVTGNPITLTGHLDFEQFKLDRQKEEASWKEQPVRIKPGLSLETGNSSNGVRFYVRNDTVVFTGWYDSCAALQEFPASMDQVRQALGITDLGQQRYEMLKKEVEAAIRRSHPEWTMGEKFSKVIREAEALGMKRKKK